MRVRLECGPAVGHRIQRVLTSLCAIFVLALATAQPAEAWTYKVIYSFCGVANCANGANPSGELMRDAAGNIYGTTQSGGTGGGGTVFRLTPNGGSWTESVLYSFCQQANCADGSFPQAGVIMDTAGRIYGTTSGGGLHGDRGTVFELISDAKPSGWTLRILHSFCAKQPCRDGATPYSRLTYAGAADGQPYDGLSPLYGTAYGLGKKFGGVAFELSRSGKTGWKYKVIHNFCDPNNCANGDTHPLRGMTLDRSGNLVGATAGNIFRLAFQPDQNRWKEIYLYTDAGSENELTLDASGKFFGSSGDVMFKLVPHKKHSTFTSLYTFCAQFDCLDGERPSKVTLDQSANMFGTAELGGNPNWQGGTVWKLSGSTIEVLHTFCEAGGSCKDGKWPVGGLLRDPSGNLFGTTTQFGEHGAGNVFELMP